MSRICFFSIACLLILGSVWSEVITSKPEAMAAKSYGSEIIASWSPNKVLTNRYSWKRDHCESCEYLAGRIKDWMVAAARAGTHDTKKSTLASSMATNYLKLYELNKCHEYYRNLSIGPFHIALELKALERKDY